MRTGFICPDGESISIESCLTACRMGERCLTKATLQALAKQRPWTGKPSTTQLINGTRLEYLKITKDYATSPQDMAFALLGTRVHLGLADADTDVSILEEKFEEDNITGILDCYELEGGVGILTDYKTWGSFRVAKALGVVIDRVPDPTGAVYKSSGKDYKKGDPKMINVPRADPANAHIPESELQLNRYRLFLKEAGFPVHKMQVEVIVRDGNTWVARDRGVVHPFYLIPVKFLDDDRVKAYFDRKSEALTRALANRILPPPCTPEETWDGKRCRDFCDVWNLCSVGREARGVKE